MAGKAQQRIEGPLGKTAIVIGGSMAGLLAARTLADYYSQVLVLERDSLPASAAPRKGVPQARHAHALLGKGQEILEGLLPGLTQHLIHEGAIWGDGRFFSGGGYHCPIPAASKMLLVSRPLLEHEVRMRLLTLPNIHIVDQCDVLGLEATENRSRVIGVCALRRQTTAAPEIMPADLTVDASGRGSRTPAWLEALGYPRPEVELVKVDLGYATRLYRRQPDHLGGALFVNVAPAPGTTRGCGMLAQEGDQWIVTLGGYCGDYPPTDEQGFLAFAKSLPTPDIYEVIRSATPLSEPIPAKFPTNQRRHYESLARFPEGLLVIGDAICSFTPIYGQGVSVAALEAVALGECLAAGTDQLAQRFFKRASTVVDNPWSITVGNDVRLTRPDESPALLTRCLHWYMDRLQLAAQRDPVVALAFRKVTNMMAAPPSLLHPAIVLRVIGRALHWSRAQRPPQTQQEVVGV
jgi:2-polyprenyl-6-methoxyphenol hydroxylase-like FAD-dependent oxidoreductase